MDLSQLTTQQLKDELEKRETNRPPETKTIVDMRNLRRIVTDYIGYVASPEFHENNEWDHYIYEAAVEAFYGKEVWGWINNQAR